MLNQLMQMTTKNFMKSMENEMPQDSKPERPALNGDEFTISKLDAAKRQLDAAIRMLFLGEDIIAVHTVAAAAGNILKDISIAKHPDKSWHLQAMQVNKLERRQYMQIMNAAANFLKHADRDPDGAWDFSPSETEVTLFWAVLEANHFGPKSVLQDFYELWWLASHRSPEWLKGLGEGHEPLVEVSRVLNGRPLQERILTGLKWRAEHFLAPMGVEQLPKS